MPPTSYDPREFGARCDACYLQEHRDGDPVPPEIHEGAKILAVSDYPGEDEVRKGRPLCGKAGQELDRGLVSLGLNRRDLSYTNALICRAPDNNMTALTAAWQAENKGRLARKEKPLPSVWACCQPRLLNEIRALAEPEGEAKTPVLNMIALGKHALQAVSGRVGSIIDLRGAPQNVIVTEGGSFYSYVEEEEAAREAERYPNAVRLRLVPTVNSSFVLRQRRWTKAFRADLGRAKRWFQGEMRWVEPVFVRNPSLAEFRAFTERFNADYPPSIDIETRMERDEDTFFDCLTDVVRTIAISDDDEGIVIHLESIDRSQEYYSPEDLLQLIEEGLKPFLESQDFDKILHNGISYDAPVLRAQLSINLARIKDTLIQHKAVESELPHKLAYVASVYTDAPSWKKGDSGEDTAKDATNDEDLGVRNVRDTAITRRVWPVLERIVASRDQQEVVRKDHGVMELCAGMHRNGLYVDQDVRRWHDVRLLKKAQMHLARIRALLANYDGWSASDAKKFNPGSPVQLRALLFDRWRMSPPASVSKNKRLTKSNLPSVGDSVLLALRSDGFLSNHQLAIVENLRRYKNAIKERGTYVLKAAPKTASYSLGGLAWEDSDRSEEDFDEDEADEFMASMAEKGAKRQGRVLADNRIHPNYNLGANTGRIASSGWNALNVTLQLRDLIRPAPGNVFIYADMDQIQLRIVAWFAQAQMYLDVLNGGGDPHAVTSAAIFGSRFTDLEPNTPEWDSMRTFSKSFSYASFFGATLETKLGVIRSTEDADGNLVYANLNEREMRKRDEAFFAKIPLPAWWESELAAYRKQGYLRDPVWGRRRDFLDGEDVNQIYCFRTQAAESAIVHDAEQEILNFIPFGRWGHGTGIVHEGYDSLMLEVPEEHAEYATGVVEHAMNRDVPGFGVKFTAKAKVVKAWYEPACGPCSKKKDPVTKKGKKVKLTWTGAGYKCGNCGYTE